jgi:lysophospholipase L1-like esterase
VVASFWLLWSALALAALWPGSIVVFGHELRKPELFERGEREQPRATPQPRLQAAVQEASPAAPVARVIDASPQRILVLGDSMIEGLLPPLGDYAVQNGHNVDAVIWYGSRTIDWGKGARLREMLDAYRPTFVIVCLGSSELFVRNVEKRAPAVEQMLRTIAPRKLVWIGPPNWAKDTGINALLQGELGAGRYFRSAELSLQRKRDRIHPTLEASKLWFELVARWITAESSAPIVLASPQKTGTPRPRVRVFPPPQ